MKGAPHLLASALLLGGFALQAADLRVCVEDESDIGAPARAGLVQELRALVPNLEIQFEDATCGGRAGWDARLSVKPSRPGIPDDVLGLALRSDGGIHPRIEVFVEPVLRLTQATDRQTLGRALARVAAHELAHFVRQDDGHAAHGLRQARLTPTDLLNEEIRPRLAASLYQD